MFLLPQNGQFFLAEVERLVENFVIFHAGRD